MKESERFDKYFSQILSAMIANPPKHIKVYDDDYQYTSSHLLTKEFIAKSIEVSLNVLKETELIIEKLEAQEKLTEAMEKSIPSVNNTMG